MKGITNYNKCSQLIPNTFLMRVYVKLWCLMWCSINFDGQVLAQPLFRIIEMGANMVWPRSDFINKEYPRKLGSFTCSFNLFRLIWRTIYVVVATIIAMAMPFFNEFLALLGAIGFWPLIVFFPIQMHIAQKQIRRLSLKWCVLQLLSFVCFLVSAVAAVGSIRGINKNIKKYKLFMYKQ